MSILIVDDNSTSAMIRDLTLKKAGYKTELAVNGLDALERLKSDVGIQLIISDISMPEMDGLTLLRELKANPELRKIPVIMATSLSDVSGVKETVSIRKNLVLHKKRGENSVFPERLPP